MNGHAHCVLCGHLNSKSLGLVFEPEADGGVRGNFQGVYELQGYSGILHGGVIASILDAAMTHCLFHRGVQAVTGDLHIRFVHPVPFDAVLSIQAWILSSYPPLYRLRAKIVNDERVMAWAEAKFMERRVQQ
jgi:acyl-coenzyme A thioesterase PaaI-like protein